MESEGPGQRGLSNPVTTVLPRIDGPEPEPRKTGQWANTSECYSKLSIMLSTGDAAASKDTF